MPGFESFYVKVATAFPETEPELPLKQYAYQLQWTDKAGHTADWQMGVLHRA